MSLTTIPLFRMKTASCWCCWLREAKDESIARQTGLSIRTLRRRMRRLLDLLGAQTRFQAGMQAARRGRI